MREFHGILDLSEKQAQKSNTEIGKRLEEAIRENNLNCRQTRSNHSAGAQKF